MRDEVSGNEQTPNNKIRVDQPHYPELVEVVREPVHQLGDESQKAQGEVPDGGGEQFQRIDSKKSIAHADQHPDSDIQHHDQKEPHSLVVLAGKDKIEA